MKFANGTRGVISYEEKTPLKDLTLDNLFIDIGAKKLVLETLVRLNRELGMTIVIISSELQELKSVSDRIAIVSEGKLVDILSPQASDADYGLAMSGIRPADHLEKEGTNA